MNIDYETIWKNKWGDMQQFGPCHMHRRRIIRKIIGGLFFNSALDVGCGEGSNLIFFKSIKNDLLLSGIDISKEALNTAKIKLPSADFYLLDCQSSKLYKKFDLVYCIDVVEHLTDDLAAIRNLFDMTNKYCLIGTIVGEKRGYESEIGHIRNYGVGELEAKMESVGFKIEKVVYWGFPFYSPLYRNLLDTANINKLTEGKMSFKKRFVGIILYLLFFLNSPKRGDLIFVLGKI